MNEYLTTALGVEHRRELLEQARLDRLARQALTGRATWWQHLSALLAGTAGGRVPSRDAMAPASRVGAHRLAH